MALPVVARLRAAGCVFAEDEARLLTAAAVGPAELEAMLSRRVAGEPLEQVLGWAEFCGLRIGLEPGVFVPRRRTQLLVREAVALASPTPVVLDLCCGSGAIGVALTAALPAVQLHAVDVEPAAVSCARRNLAATGVRVYEGDLYAPIPDVLRGRAALVVASPPYVPTAAMAMLPPEARLHEPVVALDGGSDGLDVVRRIIAAAPDWLAPEGHLLLDIGEGQVDETVAAMTRSRLRPCVVVSDELNAYVVVGSMSPQ